MAHFAKIDENNIVQEVIVVHNNELNNFDFPDSESTGIEFCKKLFGENTNWVQTSYNANFRGNFAGVGFYYDSVKDKFIPPKLYPSFVWNDESNSWVAPTAYPNDGLLYYWDETIVEWKRAYSSWSPTSDLVIASVLYNLNLKEGDVFVDLGCGDGRVLYAARETGAKLIGVDIDASKIEKALTTVEADYHNCDILDYEINCMHAFMAIDKKFMQYMAENVIKNFTEITIVGYVGIDVEFSEQAKPTLIVQTPDGPLFIWKK